jgi:4-hydroxy-3-polyprenylbenzoate decarboxylase
LKDCIFACTQKGIDDLVNFVVARLLDHLDIEHQLLPPWQG